MYMTLLLAQLLQQIAQLEYKPPLTLAVIGGEGQVCNTLISVTRQGSCCSACCAHHSMGAADVFGCTPSAAC